MKIITLDEFLMYLECPLKCKLTYIDKLPTMREDYHSSKIFKVGMNKAISSFYYDLMSKRKTSLKRMQSVWAKHYYKYHEHHEVNKESILNVRSAADTQRIHYLLNRGHTALDQFYQENSETPCVPIAINYPFTLQINDDLAIQHSFPLIREVEVYPNRRIMQIVNFKTESYPEADKGFDLRHDLEYTLQYMAFAEIFKSNIDEIVIDYVGNKQQLVVSRNQNEVNRTKQIMKGVANGIRLEDYYPRQQPGCKKCYLKEVCDKLKFEEV
jgi:hypothetical protein